MGSRRVLVTGASRGIGRGTALYLSQADWSVRASVRRPEDGARLEQESEARIRAIRLDVADDHSIEAAHKSLEEAVGAAGLCGLVNNAAVGGAGPLEYVTRGAGRIPRTHRALGSGASRSFGHSGRRSRSSTSSSQGHRDR